MMYGNYIRLAFRNLYKNKTYSLLNITGLSIGVICCILVSVYVVSETSYDKHNSNAERIFRVKYTLHLNDVVYNEASIPFPAADALKREFAAVEKTVRLYKDTEPVLIEYNLNKYKEDKFFFADKEIFSIFDFKFIYGDPESFNDPHNIIVTKSTARKYFGNEFPLGKVIEYDGTFTLKIAGVIEDIPLTSHFRFDLLAPLELQLNIWKSQTGIEGREYKWFWTGAWTYVLLNNAPQYKEINQSLPEFCQRYFPDRIKAGVKLELQPLTDIHLYSDLDNEIQPNSSALYVYTFSSVAFFVLLIACMNFVNLATAHSLKRNKEIGVRKVLGASQLQLMAQVLSETIISIIISFIVSIGTLELIIPLFNDLTGLNLSLQIVNGYTWFLFFAGLLLIISTIAGIYPAYFISRVNAVSAFRNSVNQKSGKESVRKVLVAAQFTISIALLIFVGIVNQQLNYFREKNLGFDKENIIFVNARPEVTEKFQSFKNDLLQFNGIKEVSLTSDLPGEGVNASRFIPEGYTKENPLMLPILFVDEDFVSAMSVKVKSGRNFTKSPNDFSHAFILNETAVRQLGWKEHAVGKKFSLFAPGTDEIAKEGEIIGVIEDFHFESLHHEIKPLVLTMDNFYRYYVIKYAVANPGEVISLLEKKWQEFSPDWQLEYSFLKQSLAKKYIDEENMKKLINYFTLLAFIVACLGLYGLNSYATKQRTKEIGVRKVLGASTTGILLLFTKDTVVLVLISNLIAAPIAYYAASQWLQDYAYRIEINLIPFIAALIAAAAVALITIAYQVIKAALANPVNALKYE